MFYTGMFNGLKKIVGKAADDTSNINHPQSLVLPMQNMVPNKFTKKRKVAEREYPPSIKKKYEIIYSFVIILLLLYVIFSPFSIYIYIYIIIHILIYLF